MVFDYPTLQAIAGFLWRECHLESASEAQSVASYHPTAADEAIAIVGIGCRFPGGVDSPQAFWELLRDGIDAIREVPPERWNSHAYYDGDAATRGKMTTRWGGFIESVEHFDHRCRCARGLPFRLASTWLCQLASSRSRHETLLQLVKPRERHDTLLPRGDGERVARLAIEMPHASRTQKRRKR